MIFQNKKKIAAKVADKLAGTPVADGPHNTPQPWYQNDKFPLKPIWWTRKADEQNNFGWQVTWLVFRVWNLDSFKFEFSIVADTHWGVGFTACLPYLRLVACIPCPRVIESWVFKN